MSTPKPEFIIRPIKMEDLDKVYDLAGKTGPGMTSLPADIDLLKAKIQESLNSFAIEPSKIGNESYRFVLELLPENKIIGICAIRARVGGFEPSYSYEIKLAKHASKDLGVDKEIPFLELCKEHNGPTIVSSLIVDPEYRNLKLGKFLSRTRFFFIALFRNRFTENIIAEMRGYINPEGKSPFWEGTVRHFFDMEFDKADYLSAKDKGFIADLMPHFPLYIPLLKDEVIACIGKLHTDTVPAMAFLEAEGFKRDDHVDIFDAGPRVQVKVSDIATVKNSKQAKIIDVVSDELFEDSAMTFAAKASKDFVAGLVKLKEGSNGILIAMSSSQMMKLNPGDTLIYDKLH